MEAQVQHEVDSDRDWVISPIAVPIDLPATDAEITRSERNIRQWMSYLPKTCVDTMIRMGWDKTT